MAHHQAFLPDIIANPDDDAPRLIYADWLEENGEPERAEFIRVQCELARLPRGDDRRPTLLARERRLFVTHGGTWGRGRLDERFRRGFVETWAGIPTPDL